MKRIISIVLMLVIFMPCITCFAAEITLTEKTVLYVSVDGNDSNDGSESSPLASIQGARDRLREIKQNGLLGRDGAVVYVKAGEYEIADTITFEKVDGGTKEQPIVYRSYGDGEVSFVGGLYIPYTKFQKTTNSSILNQIIDSSAKARVKQVDLRAIGYKGKLTYLADMTREREYVPEKSLKAPVEMYVGDKQMSLARYPNGTGMMGMKTLIKACQDVDYWLERKYTSPKFIAKEDRDPNDQLIFVPDDERYLLWPEDSGTGILRGPFGTGWSSNDALFTVDKQKKQIATKYPLLYLESLGPGTTKFYALNLLCELDADYEYWIDDNGIFYCILPDDAESQKIFISTCDEAMFSLQSGCEYITFRGFDFQKTRGNSVYMKNDSANNLIYDCHNANNGGIRIDGKNNGIKNSTLIGGRSVSVYGGDHEKLVSAENYVENCLFDVNGAEVEGLLISSSVGNRASYNEIHNGRAKLVGLYGKKNIFEYNDVYDGMQYSSDDGLVYGTLMSKGGVCERGNIFRYNYLHDSNSQSAIQAGNCAIYTDDCSSGSLIVGNIFKNINDGQGMGIHLAGSSDTIVDNNIFIKLKTGVLFGDRANWETVKNPENSIIISNLNVTNKGWFRNEYWRAEFPELYERYNVIDPATFAESWNCKKTHNIYWNVDGDSVATSTKYLENRDNFRTTTNPGFVDAENGGYMLKEDAEVLKTIDFKLIPSNMIGRYSKTAESAIVDKVVMKDDSPYAYVKGHKQYIGHDKKTTPIYVDGGVYTPLEFLVEAMNGTVSKDSDNSISQFSVGEINVIITADFYQAFMNGQEVPLDNMIVTHNDELYIDIEKFAELIENDVYYDNCGLICIGDREHFNLEPDGKVITYLADELNIY